MVHTISSKFFIQFSRTDTSSFSGRLSAVVVDVLVGCLIYWSNKDENPFNQNNREQASVEGSECDNLVTQRREKIWKSNFILKHLKSIELKIFWNHILKPVHDVKMAKPGQPCNYFCLLKKVLYFFFSYEIRIFCRWVWKDCNTKKRGFIPEITPCGSEVLYHVL